MELRDINIHFDVQTDSNGKDPDSASPTLRAYHQLLCKGYVDFFLLQDCVDENYNVKFWLDTPLFVSMPMPKNLDEYYKWIDSQLDFVTKRGKRIEEYCKNSI